MREVRWCVQMEQPRVQASAALRRWEKWWSTADDIAAARLHTQVACTHCWGRSTMCLGMMRTWMCARDSPLPLLYCTAYLLLYYSPKCVCVRVCVCVCVCVCVLLSTVGVAGSSPTYTDWRRQDARCVRALTTTYLASCFPSLSLAVGCSNHGSMAGLFFFKILHSDLIWFYYKHAYIFIQSVWLGCI